MKDQKRRLACILNNYSGVRVNIKHYWCYITLSYIEKCNRYIIGLIQPQTI